MTTPECSVVIPTRDCLDYLRIAIASARLQHGVELEILVVDDGSRDGTWDWLAREAKSDPRLRPLRLEGVGPGQARNAALGHARSDYIAFLDADDAWWPGKLARQLKHHRSNPEATFSFTDYLHVDPDGGVHGGCFDFWQPYFAAERHREFRVLPNAEFAILGCNVVGTSTVVASRKSLQKANGFANCKSAEDWDLWLRLAHMGPVAFSCATTMTYLMRPGSETRNTGARLDALRSILERYDHVLDPGAQAALRSARARVWVAEAEAARAGGRFGSAAALHARSYLIRRDSRTLRAALSDVRNAIASRRAGAGA